MSADLRACPKCNERDAFERRLDGSWYCLYVTQCGYTEDAMGETEPMATEEERRLNASVDCLEQTLADVMYLKDMRIKGLERELGEARQALGLGLPLVELYANDLEPSKRAILVGWVHGARAALPKEPGEKEQASD